MLTVRYIIPGRELSYAYVYDGSRMGLIYFIRGLSALSFLCELGNAKAWTREIGQVVESHVSIYNGILKV